MDYYPLDRIGSHPTATRLSVAVFAAALAAAPPVSASEYARVVAEQDNYWNAPEASYPSFQSLDIFHEGTAATTKNVELDPWQELEVLGDGWDGDRAQPVSLDALEHARRFSRSVSDIGTSFTPFAYPDGSVGLESQKAGVAAYLVVSPSNRFTYVLRASDSVHRGDDVDSEKMRELLALLY